MDKLYFIKTDNLFKIFEKLSYKYELLIPVEIDNKLFYKNFNKKSNLLNSGQKENKSTTEKNADININYTIGKYRTTEPLKNFYFRSREIVSIDFNDKIPAENKRPLCIVGVKACDLRGFMVQDRVFLNHDYTDPSYQLNRKENLIISSDCTDVLDTCFCKVFGQHPYPEKDFDINLSPVDNGFIAEIGSPKGEETLKENTEYLEKPENQILEERDRIRREIEKLVENNIRKNNIPDQDKYKGIIEKNYDSGIWQEEASTCVECGACNTICPTCHCFLLYDQKKDDYMARLRVWDSCLIKDFALVAAGANPRPFLWMRLRNRFEKKFDFFPKTGNFYACTGCGRCISACPGKIDIRRILKRLVENVQG